MLKILEESVHPDNSDGPGVTLCAEEQGFRMFTWYEESLDDQRILWGWTQVALITKLGECRTTSVGPERFTLPDLILFSVACRGSGFSSCKPDLIT